MSEHPLISEDAEPLHHLIGNEYELGWRSVWIHTQQEAVRIEYRNSRLVLTVVRKENNDDTEQQYGTMGEGFPVGLELSEEG
tara:strand:- start:1466 stop:1711 length:246 start_codon:yes stop_codon:yes gene_type:complete